jgi:enamine deaminase RidA (YjgF/YER057c/UK114 family)
MTGRVRHLNPEGLHRNPAYSQAVVVSGNVKTVCVVQGQSPVPGLEAFRRAWGDRPNPPAITVLFVAGLAHPEFLVEIDAIAVVPEE